MDKTVVDKDHDWLTITIPAQKSNVLLGFLVMWMCGWAVSEFIVVGMFFRMDSELVVRIFLFLWLLAWTIGGLFVVYVVSLQLFGREIIEINDGVLKIEKSIGGIGIKRLYETRLIQNLREVPIPNDSEKSKSNTVAIHWMFLNVGKIQFDYEYDTVKMGCLLTDDEKNGILREIQLYLSKYKDINVK